MILSQIKSLEIQLAILKKQFEQQGNLKPTRSFGDLYGIAGPADIGVEEIDAVIYQIDDSGFELNRGAAPKSQ